MVDSIYKFSDYSSVQHAPRCRLHHRQTEGKTRKEKKKKDDKKGRAAVRYSSCQAGKGSEECVGKNNRFFFFGWGGVTVDVVFVVLSVCRLVLLSASLFTVQFLNRWRPVSWWSWEEVEEGSCWAEEVDRAANKQNGHLELPFSKNKD